MDAFTTIKHPLDDQKISKTLPLMLVAHIGTRTDNKDVNARMKNSVAPFVFDKK